MAKTSDIKFYGAFIQSGRPFFIRYFELSIGFMGKNADLCNELNGSVDR